MGITAQGRALIARTKNGEQLTFTKIKIGTGVLPGGQTEASRTSLVNFLKDVPITSAYLKTPEQFNIKVLFSNEGITEAKRITEQGIYAKIGNEAEVLYAYFYLVDGFINLPVPTGDRYLKSVKEFGLKTSDTGNAQVIIDGLIVHPTIEDMNRELDKKINNSEKTGDGEPNKVPILTSLGGLITRIPIMAGLARRYTGLSLDYNMDGAKFLILLIPCRVSGTVKMSKIKGIFHINRGSESAGIINEHCEIDVQSAYNWNILKKFTNNFGLKLCTVVYKGITYYALVKDTTAPSALITFEGIWYTQDTTILVPTIISNYQSNTDISNITEIDSKHEIVESFYKRTLSGIVDLLSNIPLVIQKTSTSILSLLDDAGVNVFNVNTSDRTISGEAVSYEATPHKLAKYDGNGFLTKSKTAYYSYNSTLLYGKNYLNSGTGGQRVTLPPVAENKEIEIFNQTTANTFLSMSGNDKILDLDGNDITARLIDNYALSYIKYIRFVGMATIDRASNINYTFVWRAVQIISKSDAYDTANNIEIPTKQSVGVYIANKLAELVNSSPAALDTLKELANALGNDPNFATTVTNNIATKIEKAIFTAANQLILSTGAGTYSAKTLDEIKTLLNLNLVENGANKIPVGTPMLWFGSNAPSGFILVQGVLLQRTGIYAPLWEFANSSGNIVDDTTWQNSRRGSFSTGDGSTTFRVPDARGEVLRMLDAGRGLDINRVLGQVQSDALQGHLHAWGVGFTGQADGTSGALFTVGDISTSGPGNPINGVITDPNAGAVRVASETRAHNISVNLIMKL